MVNEAWAVRLHLPASDPGRSVHARPAPSPGRPAPGGADRGYRAWQALGRQVKKGETGIRIFVPFRRRVPVPAAVDEGDRDDAETQRVLLGAVSGCTDVGAVAAVEFDERTFAITAVEVSPGVFRTKTHIPLDRLVRFGPDVLVVAETLAAASEPSTAVE